MRLSDHTRNWVEAVFALASGFNPKTSPLLGFVPSTASSDVDIAKRGPRLHEIPRRDDSPRVVFRQVNNKAKLALRTTC